MSGTGMHLALLTGAALMLAACRQGADTQLSPVGAAGVAVERSACEARGGSFRNRGAGILACFTTPRDAGKACRTSDDCTTACLARSMTCAPITPLIGCQEIMTNLGTRITQCID